MALKDLWSDKVDEHETIAADFLPKGLFTQSAQDIAEGLKKAVHERYEIEKLDPSGEYRSAMGMLDFYINRAGKNLTQEDRARLDKAKNVLRELYGRAEA